MNDKSLASMSTEAKQTIVNNLTQTLSQVSGKLIGFKYGGYTGDGRPNEI